MHPFTPPPRQPPGPQPPSPNPTPNEPACVILTLLDIIAQGPCSRTISINTHILVIFANKRDESQALNLEKQLYPSNSKVFMEAYEDATSHVHGYLVINCDPKSLEN